jgi:hypothetical protein
MCIAVCSSGRHGGAAEITVPIELGIGGHAWVDPIFAKEIESVAGMWQKYIPQFKREVGINGADHCNKVVVESLDGAFCII